MRVLQGDPLVISRFAPDRSRHEKVKPTVTEKKNIQTP